MSSRTLILLVCLLASAGLVARADRAEPVPIRQPLAQLPMTIGEWQGMQQQPFTKEALAILGVDDYLVRAYLTPDHSDLGLYIGYYKSQRQGDTIHSPLNCLPGSGWEPVSKSSLQFDVRSRVDGPMRTIEVNRYVVQKGADEQQLVLYWYQAHNRVVASEYWGKFYLVADAVRLNRTDGSLVRVMAPVTTGDSREAVAEATGVRFVKALFPLLSNYLPE
jgi:EpsI family protein